MAVKSSVAFKKKMLYWHRSNYVVGCENNKLFYVMLSGFLSFGSGLPVVLLFCFVKLFVLQLHSGKVFVPGALSTACCMLKHFPVLGSTVSLQSQNFELINTRTRILLILSQFPLWHRILWDGLPITLTPNGLSRYEICICRLPQAHLRTFYRGYGQFKGIVPRTVQIIQWACNFRKSTINSKK